ncbi:hypothetical protein, partial [Streptomyces auratus]|uniref:hypothetical protein n=1 Tax=Streptomyces auratus TaxID=114687 RepID=UPI001BA8F02E
MISVRKLAHPSSPTFGTDTRASLIRDGVELLAPRADSFTFGFGAATDFGADGFAAACLLLLSPEHALTASTAPTTNATT